MFFRNENKKNILNLTYPASVLKFQKRIPLETLFTLYQKASNGTFKNK